MHFQEMSRRSWEAKWIWGPDEPAIENSFYLCRRELTVPKVDELTLHVSADTHYRLAVDGAHVGQGPPDGLPYHKYFDTYTVDVSGAETHCISLQVNYHSRMADTRGGVICEAMADGDTVASTDASWAITRADGWTADTYYYRPSRPFPYQEDCDLRAIPEGWQTVGFDESDWDVPDELGRPPVAGPWTGLYERPSAKLIEKPTRADSIERMHEQTWLRNRKWDGQSENIATTLSRPGRPIDCSRVNQPTSLLEATGETVVQCSTDHEQDPNQGRVTEPCIVLDMGQIYTGFVEIVVDGVNGAVLDIGSAERLVDGRFDLSMDGPFADRFTLRDGEQTIRTFSWRSIRYLKLRVGKAFDPVTIRDVRVQARSYPYEERGSFSADDKMLEAVFDSSRRTIELCSQDSIVDTPWREQAQWVGDVSAVTIGGIYSCFGETDLPGKFFSQSAANQLPTGLLNNVTNETTHGDGAAHTWQNAFLDYSLWWVQALWQHYRYTGESQWIEAYYPTVRQILAAIEPYFENDGILGKVPYRFFIDHATVTRTGTSAALNGIAKGAVEAAASMAEVVRDDGTADRLHRVQRNLDEGFEQAFVDAEGGFVRNRPQSAEQESPKAPTATEHALAAALNWDLLTTKTSERVIDTWSRRTDGEYLEAHPFFSAVLIRGLAESDRHDLALECIRNRWGKRMIEKGLTTTPEGWSVDGGRTATGFHGFHRSASHAWSGGAAQFLIQTLAGFDILEPGCTRIAIDPADVELSYTSTIPTPAGDVLVDATGDQDAVTAPEGVIVETPDNVTVKNGPSEAIEGLGVDR
jgi:hypothetical protein